MEIELFGYLVVEDKCVGSILQPRKFNLPLPTQPAWTVVRLALQKMQTATLTSHKVSYQTHELPVEQRAR